MLALRPFVVRLLAVALITGGGGLAWRAPQALRSLVDVAAEVAPSGGSVQRRAPRRPAVRGSREHGPLRAARAVRPRPDSRLLGQRDTLGTRAWPLARAGRDLIDLKRARLI